MDSERVEKLIDAAEKDGIKYSFHIPHSISVSDILPPIRRSGMNYLSDSIEVAGALHAQMIVIHMGNFYWFPVEKWMRNKARARMLKSLDILVEKCSKHGVKLALENLVKIPHGSEFYQLGDCLEDFEYFSFSLASILVLNFSW